MFESTKKNYEDYFVMVYYVPNRKRQLLNTKENIEQNEQNSNLYSIQNLIKL